VGLFNIGTTLDEAGDLEGAGELYEQALAILKGALGPKHRQVALVSTAFGWLLARQGDFPRAQELLEQALEVRVELSVDPVHLAETQLHLAQTLWLQDNGDVVALGLATKAVPVLKDSGEYGTGIFSKFESWSKTHLSEETRDALLR
ncbi:MAG: tetratricopeptide repeat protein, partial [Nannocystaceae bacterium]